MRAARGTGARRAARSQRVPIRPSSARPTLRPMSELLSRTAASEGAPGWRLLDGTLQVAVDAGGFPAAVELVAAIAEIAEAQQHHPEIDVRFDRVFVRVWSHDVHGLTQRDLDFAEAVHREVERRGLRLVPNELTSVAVGIDCRDAAAIAPFWAALLGGTIVGEGTEVSVLDPAGRSPGVWFQVSPTPQPKRGRTHLDVTVPHDEAQARIDAALAAGGHLVDDARAPHFWVLGDADGNVACVCTWQGRDEFDAQLR